MALITCRDLCIGYDSRPILSDLTFDINSGEYICVVGENGAGKSTLIKTLVGIISPKSGHLHYLNVKRNQIGYLPQQNKLNPDFPATVFEIVLSGCLSKKGILPFYTKKFKNMAMDSLETIKMTSFKNHPFATLSGGQKQRVLLARALCACDKLLVLDEPVSGLDPIVTNEFYQIISSLNKNQGLSVIMVSHDIETAVKYADKIMHLKNGIAFFGTSEEYKKSKIGKRFLEVSEND